MPLKHATETVLVAILAVMIALTGLLVATLPALPEGGLPWLILMGLAILYPAILTPLFRSRRADQPFRLLHWVPALILLAWFIIEAIGLYQPRVLDFQRYYSAAWALPAVAAGFLLLIAYCLSVIRRRLPRTLLLLALLAVFAVGGIVSARGKHWEGELAAELWQGDWWQVFGTGAAIPAGQRPIAMQNVSSQELEPSSDPSEEEWREKLRSSERVMSEKTQSRAVAQANSSKAMTTNSSSKGIVWHQTSSKPGALPTSGLPFDAIGLTLAAVYTGVLHHRAQKRLR